MNSVTVGDVIADVLVRAGVGRVFGVGGAADSLRRAFERGGVEIVLTSASAPACLMAAATAELTGAPGAAIVDDLVHAAAGLARAFQDRAPLVVLTSARRAGPAPAIAAGVLKAELAAEPATAAHGIAHALRLAMNHPRGPVHLHVACAVDASTPPIATAVSPPPPPPPDARALQTAVELLAACSRPVVVAGALCRSPQDAGWLQAFVETLPAPVVTTPKAKGVVPDPHPLVMGRLGTARAASVLDKADTVLAVGVDAAELESWAPRARTLYLGPAAPEAAALEATAEVIGDIGLILAELAPSVRGGPRADWDVAELDRVKRQTRARREGATLGPGRAAAVVREMTAAGAIAAIDGAGALRAVADAWQATAPGEVLVPNRFAAVGVAVPSAIAAQLAHPERAVIAFVDEAGLESSRAELAAVARRQTPVLVVVIAAAPAAVDAPDGLDRTRCDDEPALRAAVQRWLRARRPLLAEVRAPAETATV